MGAASLCALTVAAAGAAPPGPALFPIEVAGKHGMIDRGGAVVIPAEYAEPVVFRDLLPMPHRDELRFAMGTGFSQGRRT